MFKDHIASAEDLDTINKALEFASSSRMEFVFPDFSRIAKTLVISYDSKEIYIWQLNSLKLVSKTPHNFTIPDEWQSGWWAGLTSEKIKKLLITKIGSLNKFENPIISGGILTPFVTLQKEKKVLNNPYTTKDSYLATIIHELGHVYWNSFKLWWESDKNKNLEFLDLAMRLYQGEKTSIKQAPKFPMNFNVGEVFAFCTEYYASMAFWPKHKKNLDKFILRRIKKLIDIEKTKNLDRDDSVLSLTKNHHDIALVYGKILMTSNPKSWPKILTKT